MSGKKGQIRLKANPHSARQKAWQSMRILRTFTLPDLMRTTGEKKSDNIRKLAGQLAVHGYLSVADDWVRGEKGSYKRWSIRVNPGPLLPVVCKRCGQVLATKECKAPEEAGNV